MKYGLIGKTLKHSFSNELFKRFGYDSYQMFELDTEEEVVKFIKTLDYEFLNITIPYKFTAFKSCDEVSSGALRTEVVNFIKIYNNRSIGYNTDVIGFMKMMSFYKYDLKDKNILVLGTGATSKTVSIACSDLGAKEVRKVSRNKGDYSYNNLKKAYSYADIIINTTPVGMYPNIDETLIDLEKFSNCKLVIDVVYNPLKTNLLIQAKKLNIPYCNGLAMLFFQASTAVNLLKENSISEEQEFALCKEFIDYETNIVLIGMPGAGKSAIGRIIAEKIGKKFVDIDDVIEEKIGMKIVDYFNIHKEADFRALEEEVVCECAKECGCLIATGGGVILKENNIKLLKRNGLLFFINRPLDMLLTSENRPLSKTKEQLEELFNNRYGIYQSCCDFDIENNGNIDDCANKIIERFYNR